MVNKAIVGILVLIVLTSLGVGILIGTQIGGGGGSAAPADGGDGGSSDGGDGGDATATTTPTNGTATNGTAINDTATNGTATATVTATETTAPTTRAPTPTATQTRTQTQTATPTRTTIPSYNFSTSRIEAEMIEDINRGRSERSLQPFDTGTTTWDQLRGMTRTHSAAMADERRATFAINDYANASQRYSGSDLYDRCKYQHPTDGYIVTPSNAFQAVSGNVYAGQEYQDDGQTRFNANESAVAQAIVDDWYSSSTYRRPLVNDGTEIIAVGVSITDDGRVFASAAIC